MAKTPMQYLDRDPNAHRTDLGRVPGFQKDVRNPVQTFDGGAPDDDDNGEDSEPAETPPSAPAPAPTPEDTTAASAGAQPPNQPAVVTGTPDRPGGLG